MSTNYRNEIGFAPLTSTAVSNESSVPGDNVTEALDNLATGGGSTAPRVVLPFTTVLPPSTFLGTGPFANVLASDFQDTNTGTEGGPIAPQTSGLFVDTDSLDAGATLEIRNVGPLPPGSDLQIGNIVRQVDPTDPSQTSFEFELTGTFGPQNTIVAAYVVVVNGDGAASFAGWLLTILTPGS